MKKYLFIILLLLFFEDLLAQEVTNVSFEAQNDKVIITYDLIGEKDEEYEVKLSLKREEYSGFVFTPRSVEGDIGKGKFVGKGRKIVWFVNKDYRIDPEVEDYYFEVKAEIVRGSSWFYYVGAVILGGGTAAAVLLLKKEKENNENPILIGAPPGRP